MKLFSTLILLFALNISCFSQEASDCNQDVFSDALLEKLEGSWKATGTIGGDPVTYTITGSWELKHQFFVLSFNDTAAKPQYNARVYIGYNCEQKKYVVHWLDTFGGPFSETLGYGIKKDNDIEFSFNYPEGQFINKFSYDPATGSWRSHSTAQTEQGWITFGDIQFKKAGK